MPKIAICIDVSDLSAATEFYCGVLGCEMVKENEEHNTLSIDGVTVHISLKAEGSTATRTADCKRSYARHWTPVHLDFEVDDVEHRAEQVVLAGGTMEELKTGDWGTAAFCADPFGNGFCLLHIV